MILLGKELSQKIKDEIKEKVKLMTRKPCLACVIVEGNPASELYVATKQKACLETGILSKIIRLKNDVSQIELEKTIKKLNKNKKIDAILLQLPLPNHLNEDSAIEKISPEKDVDCLTSLSLGKLFSGRSMFAPCCADGVIALLEENNIKIEGKNVCVIGRSILAGKSISALFELKNATLTLCHSKTKDLKKISSQADILVSAVGKKGFITSDFVKNGAVVIDVGVSRINNKTYGDVDFENVKDKCSYITPAIGSIGPLTVASLLKNTLILTEKRKKH